MSNFYSGINLDTSGRLDHKPDMAAQMAVNSGNRQKRVLLFNYSLCILMQVFKLKHLLLIRNRMDWLDIENVLQTSYTDYVLVLALALWFLAC